MFKAYKKDFWLLAFGMFLFMTSFNLLIPELNTMMKNLNAGDKKGLVFVFFSIAAALARPIAGKLSDTIGRKKVMYGGVIIGAITCLAYPHIELLYLFLLIRFAHGFSAGFFPTSATAMATDLLPDDKRGQGMGVWGIFISVGFGLGQMLTQPLVATLGYNSLFYVAFGITLLAALLILPIQETLHEKQRVAFTPQLLLVKTNDVVDPPVRPAAIVMLLASTCSGFVYTITPDIAQFLALENKGIFFGIYAISSLVVRLFTSSLSDRIGRRKTLVVAVIVLFFAMLMTGFADNPHTFYMAAILYGFASGISSPALMAWMADLSLPHRRGVGSGTLYIALEGGFMLGAGLSILFYDSTKASVLTTFIVASTFAFFAFLYLIWHLITFKESK